MNPNRYAALIDPAEFGLIADYLRSPRAPILHLVHVKSEDMLPSLAAELDSPAHDATPPWMFPEPIERGLRDGSLLLSCRHSTHMDAKLLVDAKTIPRDVLCHVIYAPPYYLVHTPGLFEGTLVRQSIPQEQHAHSQSTSARVKR